MGHTEGAERGWGLSGVAFHAHLETQMADGQQNRFPGVRSFAHLGGAGGHTRGREGRWAIPRGQEGRGGSTEGCSKGPQVRGEAVLKSLWKNLERGGIKWKNIPNFVTKRERR